MSSYRNYSQKDRIYRDNRSLHDKIQSTETTKINEQRVKNFQEIKDRWREYCSYFRYYPDRFIDFIQSENPRINLYVYQRIYLRILMRYRKVFLTATRGTSKSFLQNLAFVLKCIMYPNTKLFTCAPGKEQASKIVQDNIDDIFDFFPLLKDEVRTYTKTKDYTRLVFHNGSRYDVVQMRDSTRGGRRFGGAVEEIADKKFDGDMLNSVVIPLMANDRVAMNGKIDPYEVHKNEIYITTAGNQQQFAYEKCVEVYNEMLDGKSAFCIGNSYELPCMHGQLNIDFVEGLRDSPTYAISDFMREYESIYVGSSSENLVAEEKIKKTRVVEIAEWEHCGDSGVEYVLSYDVSRSVGDQNALSALAVIKITPRGDGTYVKELVNIFSMEGQHDTWQAKFLKEKVRDFKARILVIDANGLGVGVVDQLVLDLDDGNPPYKVVNDANGDWKPFELPHAIPMVYALKSQRKETRNSDMINHFMKTFNKLDIGLLKTPHEGIKSLERKNRKKITDSEERANAEIPYVLTSNLYDEIMNLKYKARGNDSDVEQISKRIPKDKFSALMYGLFWIQTIEKDNKVVRRSRNLRDYFFTNTNKIYR